MFYREWTHNHPAKTLARIGHFSKRIIGNAADRKSTTAGAPAWGVLVFLEAQMAFQPAARSPSIDPDDPMLGGRRPPDAAGRDPIVLGLLEFIPACDKVDGPRNSKAAPACPFAPTCPFWGATVGHSRLGLTRLGTTS